MPDNTKETDDTRAYYSFDCSVEFTRDIAYEINFLDKDIDNYHQIPFTLPDNTKGTDDSSENYSFVCSVDFIRDIVY